MRTNNGLLILEAIIAILLPVTTLRLLDLIDELREITHQNEETVDYLGTRLQNLFARLNSSGCKTMADLHMAFAQHCVLRGTYKSSRPIRSLLDQLMLQDKTLQNWKTPLEFFSSMTSLFTDGEIFTAGIMQPVNVPRVRKAGGANTSSTTVSDINDNFVFGKCRCDQAAVDAMLKKTNCILCVPHQEPQRQSLHVLEGTPWLCLSI